MGIICSYHDSWLCLASFRGGFLRSAGLGGALQVPGDAEAALHRLQTKLLDVPAGAKRASREVCIPICLHALSVLHWPRLDFCMPIHRLYW